MINNLTPSTQDNTHQDTIINYNDIEMLQMAGVGIAMGNAPEEVKAHADYITLDNDSDGISFALEQFIP